MDDLRVLGSWADRVRCVIVPIRRLSWRRLGSALGAELEYLPGAGGSSASALVRLALAADKCLAEA